MSRRLRIAVALLGLLYVGQAVRYIAATSLEIDAVRVFTLWDDAMISMRYAHNLAAGHGLVWNPGGERVQGISNLGITLVMAAIHLLPVSTSRTSLVFQLLNGVGLLAILALAWRSTRALFPADPAVGPVAALAVAAYAPLAVWSLQGSDAGAVTLLVFLALWLAARAENWGRAWPTATWLVLALGVVLRLDTTLVYAAFLGAALLGPGRGRAALVGGGLLVATWAAILGFGWLYYGDPLPNTWYLKATGAPRALVLESGVGQLRAMLTPLSVSLLAATACSLVLWCGRRRALLAAAASACVLLAYDVWVGGDWLFTLHSRFVVPAVALYLVLHVGAVAHGLARWLPEGPGRSAALVGLSLLGLLTFHAPFALREWWLREPHTVYHQDNEWNARLGFLLRRRTAPDTTVAVHWAGVPIYFGERAGVDVLGRSDRHIARLPIRLREFKPGHSKWDWDYVIGERRPDVVSGASYGLLEHPGFVRSYYRVNTPVRLDRQAALMIYVRRDSIAKLVGPGFRLYSLETGDRVPR